MLSLTAGHVCRCQISVYLPATTQHILNYKFTCPCVKGKLLKLIEVTHFKRRPVKLAAKLAGQPEVTVNKLMDAPCTFDTISS